MHSTYSIRPFERQPSTFFGFFLFVALLLHLAVFVTYRFFPELFPKTAALPPRIIEVFRDDRPLAQTMERDDPTDAKARYKGERRNRVAEETKSPRTGRFQDQATERSTPDRQSEDGVGPPKTLSLRDLTRLSQNPYKLDDGIRDGEQTMVNTDAVYYASFMNRLSEAIYPAWVRHLKDATKLLKLDGNPGGISQTTFITRLGVEMDTAGNIVSLQVLKSSGVTEIDDAPKSAIWEKDPFFNPPLQMFAANENTVRFVYEFHFELKKGFSIFPSISL